MPVHQINNATVERAQSQQFNRSANVSGANHQSYTRDFGSPLRTSGSPQGYSPQPQSQHNYNAPTSPQPSAPVASYHSQPAPARTETSAGQRLQPANDGGAPAANGNTALPDATKLLSFGTATIGPGLHACTRAVVARRLSTSTGRLSARWQSATRWWPLWEQWKPKLAGTLM